MKVRGGVLGVILVVAVIGNVTLSGQLSPEQLIEELLGGGGSDGTPAAAQNTPSTDAVRHQLSELRVRPAGSMAGYSREEFPHWSDAQEFGWRLSSGTPDLESCDVVSGRWLDPYSGQTCTDPAEIDIDHIVPLANAWRSGASSWSTAKRESFANVPRDLLSVDDSLNQSSATRDPRRGSRRGRRTGAPTPSSGSGSSTTGSSR